MIKYDIFEQFILHSPYRDSSPKNVKYPQAILGVYDFLLADKCNWCI